MLRKLLTGLAAVCVISGVAYGANLSLMSGPQDPSQLLASLNTLIRSINTGVNGRLMAGLTATGNTVPTAEISLMTYSLPANQIAANGDAVRVVCWGTSATNINRKTAKLYFGTSSVSTDNSIAPTPFSNYKWSLSLIVMRSGASTQTVMGGGMVNATPLSVYTNAGTDAFTAAQTIRCTSSNTTAVQDLTAQGMLVEQIK